MKNIAKWVGVLAAIAVVHAVVILAVTGVPRPSTIVAEDVGRIPWTPLLRNTLQRFDARASRSLVGWMPDGSGLLVMGTHRLFDARLHLVSEPGTTPRFLPAVPRNASVYVPNDRDYMVLGIDRDGDEQYALYRWDLGGADPVLLTSGEERAQFGAFQPDGHAMAYVSTRRNGRDFDLYMMDVRDPSSDKLIAEMEGLWRVVDWEPVPESGRRSGGESGRDPGGNRLLMARAASNIDLELFTFDIESGDLRRVGERSESGVHMVSPQWSRDGRSLYYGSDRGTEFSYLRKFDLETGRETLLSDEIPWDVESIQQSGAGDLLVVGINEDGRTRYYTTDPEGTKFAPLDLFENGQISVGLHPTEPVMLVNHADERGQVRGYEYDLGTHELTLWAGGEARDRELPEPRLVRYPTFDEVDGAPRLIPAFVYPGVGEGPRPVVINIHGGPEAQARLGVGRGSSQRAGITVITPNVRGSTGYGRTYTRLDDWKLREDAVRDIGALLDWIAEQPDMDQNRVVVTGGSYGGYMVLASLVHYSPRILCGIDIVGVSNFVTFLENTADYRKDIRRAEYGDERIPEMRQFLEDIAPLNNAERITSRLMVVQGTNDPRVPVTESRQMVERVRANGLEVSYIEGLNEGHGFKQPWNALWTGFAQEKLTQECLLGG